MHRCKICGKGYKKLKSFQEHRALCEAIKFARTDLITDETIPSSREMWLVLKQLLIKNEKLEKKVTDLTKLLNKEKKKISMIDWLNKNKILNSNYEHWIKNIKTEQEELNILFDKGFIEGISHAIVNNLPDKETNIITAFEQKPNKLYIYDKDVWRELNNKDLENIIDKFHLYIQKEFEIYNKKNSEKFKDHEKSIDLYKNLQKVMGLNISLNDKITKIKLKIYAKLKFNLKNIVEFSFL